MKLELFRVSPVLPRPRGHLLSLIAVLVAAAVGPVLVNTGQQSDFLVSEHGVAVEDVSLPATRQLPVPYVGQGATRWCLEAALSMVLGYYGETVGPSDIAAGLGDGPDDSVSLLDMFLARWTLI